MNSGYQAPFAAQNYLNFLASTNGLIQQQLLIKAFGKHLAQNPEQEILDAACGPGWLTKELSITFPKAQGCDFSKELIAYAKKHYKGIDFLETDVTEELPYNNNFFDSILLNMAAPDIASLSEAFKNLFAKLKPGGQFLVTVPNPAYTFPAAVWKRSILDILTGQKPSLKLKTPPKDGEKIIREFEGQTIASYFYSLPYYINTARTQGFTLVHMEEVRSKVDSDKFDFHYTFFRYPLILLLEFAKPG